MSKNYTHTWALANFLATPEEIKTHIDDENAQTAEQQDQFKEQDAQSLGLRRLCLAALWSPAEKGLTSWLSFLMFYCVFVTFPYSLIGHVWYMVSIPDICHLSYFPKVKKHNRQTNLSYQLQ